MKGLISRHAIKILQYELALANKYLAGSEHDIPPCSDRHWRPLGLSCAHRIIQIKKRSGPKGPILDVEDVHRHWRLRTEDELDKLVETTRDSLGDVATSALILGPSFDRPDPIDGHDTILDPPLPTTKRSGKRKAGPSQECPDVLPTGRISTQAERAAGTYKHKRACRWCGKKGHTAKDCNLRVINNANKVNLAASEICCSLTESQTSGPIESTPRLTSLPWHPATLQPPPHPSPFETVPMAFPPHFPPQFLLDPERERVGPA